VNRRYIDPAARAPGRRYFVHSAHKSNLVGTELSDKARIPQGNKTVVQKVDSTNVIVGILRLEARYVVEQHLGNLLIRLNEQNILVIQQSFQEAISCLSKIRNLARKVTTEIHNTELQCIDRLMQMPAEV